MNGNNDVTGVRTDTSLHDLVKQSGGSYTEGDVMDCDVSTEKTTSSDGMAGGAPNSGASGDRAVTSAQDNKPVVIDMGYENSARSETTIVIDGETVTKQGIKNEETDDTTTAPKGPQSEDVQVEGNNQEGSVHLESGVGDIWGEIQTVTPVTLNELSQDLATELQQACQETPEGSPSKKQKFPISYSDVELDICKWFRDHPIFYDPTDLQSKNKQKKDRLMLQKAQEHNTTVEQLTLWWKSQRTMYGRLLKRKHSRPGLRMTQRQNWTLRNFSFLKAHISVRNSPRKQGLFPVDDDPHPEVDLFPDIIDSGLRHVPDLHTAHPPMYPKPNNVNDALEKLVDLASGTHQLCQKVEDSLISSRNPRVAFSQWIAAETESLPEQLYCQFQTDVFATVMKYRNIARQNAQPPNVSSMPNASHNQLGNLSNASPTKQSAGSTNKLSTWSMTEHGLLTYNNHDTNRHTDCSQTDLTSFSR